MAASSAYSMLTWCQRRTLCLGWWGLYSRVASLSASWCLGDRFMTLPVISTPTNNTNTAQEEHRPVVFFFDLAKRGSISAERFDGWYPGVFRLIGLLPLT